MLTPIDFEMMGRALRLAEQGLYTTTPNPRVGCVIVKDGQVIGEGAHLKAGEPHAEVHALRQAADAAQGADVYVTLEPCSHYGRTPPCADALIAAKPKRVIVAMQDPNPKVAGQGITKLQSHGIAVEVGLMKPQAEALNLGFISRMTRQLPYVRSKIAATLDGKTALNNGKSQWITSDAAREDVQRWRARSCAMLTGIGTVLADNPSLLVRSFDIGRQPLRVVVDSTLKIPMAAQIIKNHPTLIAYASDPNQRLAVLQQTGVQLIQLTDNGTQVSLKQLLRHLATLGVNEVMCEAGQSLNGALAAQKLVDEFILYYAPKLMGHQAQGMLGLPTLTEMQQCLNLNMIDTRMFGRDIRILAHPQYHAD